MPRQGQSLAMAITAGARMGELCGELPAGPAKLICTGIEGRTHTGRGTRVPGYPVQPPASSGACWGRRDEAGRGEMPLSIRNSLQVALHFGKCSA